MASHVRPRPIPRCTSCLKNYAFGSLTDHAAPSLGIWQQIRGKKKLTNSTSNIPVRLRKDVKTFGRRGKRPILDPTSCLMSTNRNIGAIVPIPRGQMRNDWFPRGIAAYVTLPELKTLRLKNTAMERDFEFGITRLAKFASATSDAMKPWQKDVPSDIKSMTDDELRNASAFQKKLEVEKLSSERSVELLEIFVGPRLEFYRQPIAEEKEPEAPPPEPRKGPRLGRGAAADLLAARTPQPARLKVGAKDAPQAIYGSVSTLDVLLAIRAAMAENDEAARVVLHEEEISFVDLPEAEEGEAGKLKHTGDFAVEIRVRGTDVSVKRIVRVIPQDL